MFSHDHQQPQKQAALQDCQAAGSEASREEKLQIKYLNLARCEVSFHRITLQIK